MTIKYLAMIHGILAKKGGAMTVRIEKGMTSSFEK